MTPTNTSKAKSGIEYGAECGKTIAAIIVVFEAALEDLAKTLERLLPQVDLIILADNNVQAHHKNTTSALLDRYQTTQGKLVHLDIGYNSGVATALNLGVTQAKQQGCSHAVLFDQDSVPDPNMIAHLLAALDQLAGQNPCVVGPAYQCCNTRRHSFALQRSTFGWRRLSTYSALHPLSTEMLISSGSLFSLATYEHIGPFDESLFIDHIDTDWCLRARSLGIELFIIPKAQMSHNLGAYAQRIWWGGWRYLPIHSPPRLYFMFRNSLALYRRQHAYFGWILFDLRRLVLVLSIHLLYHRSTAPLASASRGLWHGLLNKLSKK